MGVSRFKRLRGWRTSPRTKQKFLLALHTMLCLPEKTALNYPGYMTVAVTSSSISLKHAFKMFLRQSSPHTSLECFPGSLCILSLPTQSHFSWYLRVKLSKSSSVLAGRTSATGHVVISLTSRVIECQNCESSESFQSHFTSISVAVYIQEYICFLTS